MKINYGIRPAKRVLRRRSQAQSADPSPGLVAPGESDGENPPTPPGWGG